MYCYAKKKKKSKVHKITNSMPSFGEKEESGKYTYISFLQKETQEAWTGNKETGYFQRMGRNKGE